MKPFRTYWMVYGGWRALLLSPYLWCSGIFAAVCKPIWFDGRAEGFLWTYWALSLLSGMISFSIGGMAVFLSFSNETFLKLLRQNGKEQSYLMQVATAFFHFILVQFGGIAAIILVISYQSAFLSGLAFWLFCYAISCGIAAAAALLGNAAILNRLGKLDEDNSDP